MPRVDLYIRVRDDIGNDIAVSTFSIEQPLVDAQLDQYHSAPRAFANYLGVLFRDQTLRVFSATHDLVSAVRSWSVDPARGGSLRDTLRRMGVEERSRNRIDPTARVNIPLAHWDGPLPASLVDHIRNGLEPQNAQMPPPQDISVESLQEAVGQLRAGNVSRQSLMEAFGAEEAPPVRGHPEIGVMIDDDQRNVSEFSEDLNYSEMEDDPREIPLSELSVVAAAARNRHQATLETFRQVYGGRAQTPRREVTVRTQRPPDRPTTDFLPRRTSGIEPTPADRFVRRTATQQGGPEPQNIRPPVPEEVKTPENRPDIPNRYQRKPVI